MTHGQHSEGNRRGTQTLWIREREGRGREERDGEREEREGGKGEEEEKVKGIGHTLVQLGPHNRDKRLATRD